MATVHPNLLFSTECSSSSLTNMWHYQCPSVFCGVAMVYLTCTDNITFQEHSSLVSLCLQAIYHHLSLSLVLWLHLHSTCPCVIMLLVPLTMQATCSARFISLSITRVTNAQATHLSLWHSHSQLGLFYTYSSIPFNMSLMFMLTLTIRLQAASDAVYQKNVNGLEQLKSPFFLLISQFSRPGLENCKNKMIKMY